MSKTNIRFETLVDRARREPISPVDVADLVARRIAPTASVPTAVDWALWSVAGLSVAAAASVLLISFDQGLLVPDPLADWLRPLVTVMQ